MSDSSHANPSPAAPGSLVGDLPIPDRLAGKLAGFQERLWSVKIAEGALIACAGLACSYLVVFLLDRVFDTPTWLRVILLLLGTGVPALCLPLRWRRWVWQQRSLEQTARLLKRAFPRLGDELLGIIELAHGGSASQSRVLVEAAMRHVDERAAPRDFSTAVPAKFYQRWVLAAGVALGLVALFAVISFAASSNALARWLTPWKAVDRYTFAQLEPVATKLVVPYAEPFHLSPQLEKDTRWEPDSASVRLRGQGKVSSDVSAGAYDFALPPQKEATRLALRVGDATEQIEVTPMVRPEATELEAIVRLPDYLRQPSDAILPIRSGSVAILRGASASFAVTTTRELAEAQVDGQLAPLNGASFTSPAYEVDETTKKRFSWRDVAGLEAKSPLELTVIAVDDASPQIFAKPLSQERFLLPDEVVSFEVAASDDYGVRQVGLMWNGTAPVVGEKGRTVLAAVSAEGEVGPPVVPSGEKVVAAGDPEKRELTSVATFSASRDGVSPQTVEIRLFAEDYLPGRERSVSPTFVLHILSPADHAKWLTEEFGKWFRSAREVYEQEQLLHEGNEALRALSAEELERAENRRKIEAQAAAERSNARRLEAVTEAGRELVRQAAKNEDFDPQRLENWAEAMQSLAEIAEKRMPSVADLLSQAAEAEAGTPGQQSPGSLEKSGEETPAPASPKAPEAAPNPSTADAGSKEGAKGEPKPDSPSSPQGPAGLPQTTLIGKAQEPREESTTPVVEKLAEAVEEQKELLAQFSQVTADLQEILSQLESSTFVKRFQAASRKQLEIAETLGETLGRSFGIPKQRLAPAMRDQGLTVASAEEAESWAVYDIQNDLEAYYQRKQEGIYKNVLDQMKALAVVPALKVIGTEASLNLHGRSIAAAQYWGDTFDRWAEELVAAAKEGASDPNQDQKKKEGLPPEIVLEIMKVLREETALRDETREMEATRPGLAPDVYRSMVRPLELTQTELREIIDGVVTEIGEIPGAALDFGKEIQLLELVSDVMRQSHAVLTRPDTGPEAIAAQTEVIELLLQSQRQPPSGGGGGGGGSSPGGGGAAGGGNGSALGEIGLGPATGASGAPSEREVNQATGKAGRELPDEFRRGLDHYFNDLEQP
jgi:hypothetical protein